MLRVGYQRILAPNVGADGTSGPRSPDAGRTFLGSDKPGPTCTKELLSLRMAAAMTDGLGRHAEALHLTQFLLGEKKLAPDELRALKSRILLAAREQLPADRQDLAPRRKNLRDNLWILKQVTPETWGAFRNNAYVHNLAGVFHDRKSGEGIDASLRHIARARQIDPHLPHAAYNEASKRVKRGEVERGLAALGVAMELARAHPEYGAKPETLLENARKDTDFKQIWNTPALDRLAGG